MRISAHAQARSIAMSKAKLAVLKAVTEELTENPLSDWELASLYTELAYGHIARVTRKDRHET